MSQDTDPIAPPTARESTAALIELLDSIDGQPEAAVLRDEVFWSVRGRSRALIGRLYVGDISGEPLQLLERWREKFGGTIEATGEKYTDNWAWYALATAVGGVPVTLLVPVEQPEVEQQLRARIAELEAALTEHHQPVPSVLTGKAGEIRA